jgi:hypothetical protein
VGWRSYGTRSRLPSLAASPPHPAATGRRCASPGRVDPPPPGEGKKTRTSAFSRHTAPEFRKFVRPKKQGRREDRVRAAPAVSRAKMHIAKRTRAYRFSGSSPAFPAQWFYDLFRALPGETGLFCHRRPRDAKHHRELDTSHWGVRTTRLRRPRHALFVKSASASIAPRPNVSDDGQRPSLGTGWRRISR